MEPSIYTEDCFKNVSIYELSSKSSVSMEDFHIFVLFLSIEHVYVVKNLPCIWKILKFCAAYHLFSRHLLYIPKTVIIS